MLRRTLPTTAALTVLLLACGKDEPAAAPPPPAPAAGIPQPAPDAAKDQLELKKAGEDTGSAPQPAADPGRTAAPANALPALSTSQAPAQRAPLNPTSVATIPADVVALGGTPSLAALVRAFASQAAQIDGLQVPSDPLPTALQMIQQKTGLDLAWLDTDKPLRFAVPDPKKYPEGFVLLLPVKAGVTVDAKSLAGASEGGGHHLTVKIDGREVFLDQAGDAHLLATSHGDLAKSLDSFVKDLGAWTPQDPLVIDTSMENVTRIFADEMKGAKEMVSSFAGAMAQSPEMAAKIGPMMQMAAGGFALVEGTARVALALDPSGDFPRLALAFKGLPASPLEGMAKDLAGRKVAFAGLVPADAWLAFGYDIPGGVYVSDVEKVVNDITAGGAIGPLQLNWSDDDKKTLVTLLTRLKELQGSQSMSWIRQEGSRAFILETIMDAKDGPGMRDTALALGEVFYKKLLAEGRKAFIAQGAPAEQFPADMSFKDFLTLVSSQTKQIGVGLTINEAMTKGGSKATAFNMSIDWSRLPMRGQAELVGDLIGNDIGLSIVGEGKLVASALGPDAANRAARILDSATTPAEPSDPWLALAKDEALFALMRPARLLRALVDVVPALTDKREAIGKLTDDPLVLRAHSDGTTISLETTLPAKLLIGLATLQ